MIKVEFLAPFSCNPEQSLSIFKGECSIPIFCSQSEHEIVSSIMHIISKLDFIPHYDESDLYGELVLAVERMKRAERNGYFDKKSLCTFKVSWNKPKFWQGLKQWVKWKIR